MTFSPEGELKKRMVDVSCSLASLQFKRKTDWN